MKDYYLEYQKEQKANLEKIGLVNLTEDQMYLVTEPSEAPENFACDGEITPKVAYSRWVNRLSESGLTKEQIKQAIKFNFG
jgi:hypothetical protein